MQIIGLKKCIQPSDARNEKLVNWPYLYIDHLDLYIVKEEEICTVFRIFNDQRFQGQL